MIVKLPLKLVELNICHSVSYLLSFNYIYRVPKSVFKFAHAETMIPLECLLELYKDKRPLTAATYQEHQSRLFRTSWMSPFAANVAFVLLNCSADDEDHQKDPSGFKLQVLHNEIPVDLPFCRSGQSCSLLEFSHYVNKVVAECNFNTTCCVESIGNCEGCKAFRFDEWNVFCICCVVVAFAAWIVIFIIEFTGRYRRARGNRYTIVKDN